MLAKAVVDDSRSSLSTSVETVRIDAVSGMPVRLRVNQQKSAVAPVGERKFLGYRLGAEGTLGMAPQSLQRTKAAPASDGAQIFGRRFSTKPHTHCLCSSRRRQVSRGAACRYFERLVRTADCNMITSLCTSRRSYRLLTRSLLQWLRTRFSSWSNGPQVADQRLRGTQNFYVCSPDSHLTKSTISGWRATDKVLVKTILNGPGLRAIGKY